MTTPDMGKNELIDMAGNPEKAIAIAMNVGAVGMHTEEKLFDVTETPQISMKERYREQGKRYRKAVWERRIREIKKVFSHK